MGQQIKHTSAVGLHSFVSSRQQPVHGAQLEECVQKGAVPEAVLKRIAARAARTFGLGPKNKPYGSLYWSLWYIDSPPPEKMRDLPQYGTSHFEPL